MKRALLLAALIAMPAFAGRGDLRSVAGMEGHARVLIAFSPSLKDKRLDAQRKMMARYSVDAAERDLIFVQVSEGQVIGAYDKDAKLRRRFQTPASRYRTLLIGKDGHVALDEAGPIDARHLTAAIDAMPMRRAEVARARAGHPLPRSN